MEKANNVVRIPFTSMDDFFKYWLTFLKPFNKLTPSEIVVASAFLKQRYDLSQKINDPELLDQVLFSRDSRKLIRDMTNVEVQVFQVVVTSLRKKKFFLGDKINPKYIPNFQENSNTFSLLLYFDGNK